MADEISKTLYWTPRILSIIFIIFLSLFSLDVFGQGYSAGQIAIGLLMHNIPTLIMLIILIISWRFEVIGGIAYILAGLYYAGLILKNIIDGLGGWYMLPWVIQISGPAFLIGILFLIGWGKKIKAKSDNIRIISK